MSDKVSWSDRLEYWGSEGPALLGTLLAVAFLAAWPVAVIAIIVHALLR